MNIVVCIKQVPDTKGGVKFNPDGTLDRASMMTIMNPDDKAGLEAALRLKDQYGATVTALTMGLPKAEEVLREAIAMGADKGILVTDRVLGGADTWATSQTLAGALRNLEYDLIITGRQAIDGDTAQVGPQISEHLNILCRIERYNLAASLSHLVGSLCDLRRGALQSEIGIFHILQIRSSPDSDLCPVSVKNAARRHISRLVQLGERRYKTRHFCFQNMISIVGKLKEKHVI